MGLEYRCFGDGDEVFVLENGIGRSMYEWYPIAKELSKSGKVVLYHRAGYGKSDCSEKTRTADQIAQELRELLCELHILKPVILAGYEFGGLCAQQFARKYKEMVKSIILMDSMAMSDGKCTDGKTMNCYLQAEPDIGTCNIYAKKTQEELRTLLLKKERFPLPYLNEQEQKEYLDFLTSPSRYETMARETEALLEAWEKNREKQNADIQNNKKESMLYWIPVNVMVHDQELGREYLKRSGMSEEEADQTEKDWLQIQLAIASESHYGRLIYAENSGIDFKQDAFDLTLRVIRQEIARNPKEAISYCGINCYLCPVFLATVMADQKQKERLAKAYSNDNMTFSSEDICCDGCGTRRSSYNKMCAACQIKECAISKLSDLKNETCADCSHYPCTLHDTYTSKDGRELLDCLASKKML